jgi:predicted nucleic acid-binding Zn ribbon protein
MGAWRPCARLPGSPDRCVVCGRPMRPRKGKVVCSGGQRKAEAQRERDAEIRALLEAALNKLREAP